MHAQCLVAEFGSLKEAQVGLTVLENFDFKSDAVSMVSRGHEEALEKIGDQQRGAEEQASAGKSAGLGTLIGGTVTAPIAVGTMIGPFIVAGPLIGMAVGAAAGGLLSEADQWGIHEQAARDYEQRVREGAVLVIVTSTPPRLDEAERGLKTTGPKSLERFSVQHQED
jgi:uncharacterized membrane protein